MPPRVGRRFAGRGGHGRLIGVAVGATLAVALAACASAPGRDEARDNLVEQLVGRGLPSAIAACVVDAFFAARTDDELREFYDREELTGDEAAELAQLGEDCGA